MQIHLRIDYPIPGNDDSISATALMASLIQVALLEGGPSHKIFVFGGCYWLQNIPTLDVPFLIWRKHILNSGQMSEWSKESVLKAEAQPCRGSNPSLPVLILRKSSFG